MSKTDIQIERNCILTSPRFEEPMRVVHARRKDGGGWSLELAGEESRNFVQTDLRPDDLADIEVRPPGWTYGGGGQLLRLGVQARMLEFAWEYDPCFALSVSRVDPLPHQLEAVYDHLLKSPRVRFLLADDAGAGKTVMAGLLVRELQLRGLAERILVACPANLAFQWQREMTDKFGAKFTVMRGGNLREQYGVNLWQEHDRVIVSLDLAKRPDIVRGLSQSRWHLVIVDEAHRMSWTPPAPKSERYKLGELLRDSADNILLLTATPHKGVPEHFSRFLQLLDRDAYEGVRSIEEAMKNNSAPFYLRRAKEAMVHFPRRGEDGKWRAAPIFTSRIPRTVQFQLEEDSPEWLLYQDVTEFVKRQSRRAAERGNDRAARAVGFLMSLYQRRLASSAAAIRRSLERRAKRLHDELANPKEKIVWTERDMPDPDEMDEMDDAQRESAVERLESASVSHSAGDIRREIGEIRRLAEQAAEVESQNTEAKITKLREILRDEGFEKDPGRRLLIFTEFRDTLSALEEKLKSWGFKVGVIHGGMRPGAPDERGTRLFMERQFREGEVQILVATEAAGEGVNLQVCNFLFNYDIPWNPNRLEQRMGRIHRYGQTKDCLLFNFVAANTIEGGVLIRLLEKLEEIRGALQSDSVFDVVGDILPAAKMESVFREYYAGKMGENDLESRILDDVNEARFRGICRNALEGLAMKRIHLPAMLERKARAQERRVVPETVARFVREAAEVAGLKIQALTGVPHGFSVPGPIPSELAEAAEKNGETLARNYLKCAANHLDAEKRGAEWVGPEHPLFRALRRDMVARAEKSPGARFYSLTHEKPARIDFYEVALADGNGNFVGRRVFAAELSENNPPREREPGALAEFEPVAAEAEGAGEALAVAALPEAGEWLREGPVRKFLEKVQEERGAETGRIQKHVEIALTELIAHEDLEVGRAADDKARGVSGADGRLAQAQERHRDLIRRRDRRMGQLKREGVVSLREARRFASALILPHPERQNPEVRRMRPNPETEGVSMRAVMEYEKERGRTPRDVHEKNLGYDISSVDRETGELRLIEVKGLAGNGGEILLTPNEFRVAEDRADCYWLYVVVRCAESPVIRSRIQNPAKVPMRPVSKIAHYRLRVRDLAEGESGGK